MPRHEAHYDLTPAEKRDLIKLIEQGRPLPDKYRFLLFEDKREVELLWNGKTREVCTAILPFQTLEHIDEPRKERGAGVSPAGSGGVSPREGTPGGTPGEPAGGDACATKDALTLAVELTDFSVYYSQGISESITAELKAGKSEVVCEAGQLIKISKDRQGIETREVLTKQWTDWVDYWAVDFDYESRKEIIKEPKRMGVEGELPGAVQADSGEFIDFEERWTGAYIFENEWQSFRTRQDRALELISAPHTYEKPGRYVIAVKVIDIFGNDTMTLVPVTVG